MKPRTRLLAGVAEQGLTSVTSLVIVIVGARRLSVTDFGVYALLQALVVFGVGLARAWLVEPQLVVTSASTPQLREVVLGRALLAAAVVSAAVGVVGGVTWALDVPVASATIALFAGMLTFDGVRHWCVGTQRVGAALLWAGLILPVALALLAAIEPDSLGGVLAVVSGAYCLVALLAFGWWWSARRRRVDWAQRLEGDAAKVSHHRRNYSAEYLLGTGGYYGATLVAAAILGPTAVAGLRGAETLLAPARVLLAFLPNAVISTVDVRARLGKAVAMLSIGVGLWGAAVYAAGWVLLARFGDQLFGQSADVIREVYPWLALSPVIVGVAVGPMVGLRALALSHVSVRVRVVSFVTLVGGAAFGTLGGPAGVGMGIAVASALTCAVWWIAYLTVSD